MDSQLQLLSKVVLSEFLANLKDPKRELLERMETLRRELEVGRREIAQQGGSVGDYEAAETALRNQIEFAGKQAAKFAEKDEKVAREHLQKQVKIEAELEDVVKATVEFKKSLEDLEKTVDAVAKQLGALEKAYGKIETMQSQGKMLYTLNQIATTHRQTEELEEAAQREIYKQEALAEIRGEAPQASSSDNLVETRLAELKKKKGKSK